MKSLIRSFLGVLAMSVAMPLAAHADQPGAHPAYLHALTDLRAARWELTKRPGDAQVKWDEATAIKEIDAVIGDVKAASIDDGKDVNDHPKEDSGKLDRGARLHSALKLLKSAHHDIKEKESNSFADGLQKKSLGHLDAAIKFTEEGISNAEHPNK